MTRKPDLNGLRVLVTRPQPGASRTTGYLQELGATVTCFPLLGIRAVNPGPEIRSVISDLDNVDLLVFVSANAVNSLLGILEDSGHVA